MFVQLRENREGELFCGENYRMSELQGAVALAQIRKAPRLIAGYRAAFGRIASGLKLTPGVQLQRVADPQGDAGICMILFLPTVEQTKRALVSMQAAGVPAGGIYDQKVKDWHIYSYWQHILEKKSVARDGLPWTGVPPEELPHYFPTMCQQCTDLLSRAIMIDIHADYSAEDCAAIVFVINKAVAS